MLGTTYHFPLIPEKPKQAASSRPSRGSESARATNDVIDFETERIIGHGSFGVVFQARITTNGTNETVAIKKVLQDGRFRNRELQIMRHIARNPHPNIVALRHSFYSRGSGADEVYLNLVLEFVPEVRFFFFVAFAPSLSPCRAVWICDTNPLVLGAFGKFTDGILGRTAASARAQTSAASVCSSVHVPTRQGARAHPRSRHLSSRH